MSGAQGWGLWRGGQPGANGGQGGLGAAAAPKESTDFKFPKVGVPQHLQPLLQNYAPIGGMQPIPTEQLYSQDSPWGFNEYGARPDQLAQTGKGGGGAPGMSGKGGGGAPQMVNGQSVQDLMGSATNKDMMREMIAHMLGQTSYPATTGGSQPQVQQEPQPTGFGSWG